MIPSGFPSLTLTITRSLRRMPKTVQKETIRKKTGESFRSILQRCCGALTLPKPVLRVRFSFDDARFSSAVSLAEGETQETSRPSAGSRMMSDKAEFGRFGVVANLPSANQGFNKATVATVTGLSPSRQMGYSQSPLFRSLYALWLWRARLSTAVMSSEDSMGLGRCI
jgi:hypothetical protein